MQTTSFMMMVMVMRTGARTMRMTSVVRPFDLCHSLLSLLLLLLCVKNNCTLLSGCGMMKIITVNCKEN